MSDEEERAQRSVERMFPEVARFLGQLPTYGPTGVQNVHDDQGVPDVVVRVDVQLSRAELFAVLVLGFTQVGVDRDPDLMSVGQIRDEVEACLASSSFVEISRAVEQVEDGSYTGPQLRRLDALRRAVDRAYSARSLEPRPVQQPRYGDGTVTLQTLDHGEIVVDEPVWCQGHAGEQVVQRVDVTHVGRTVVAEVETDGGTIEFLPARIAWGPFAEARPEPYPSADVDDFPAMDPDQLRELAAETALHAGRLYRLSNELYLLRRTES